MTNSTTNHVLYVEVAGDQEAMDFYPRMLLADKDDLIVNLVEFRSDVTFSEALELLMGTTNEEATVTQGWRDRTALISEYNSQSEVLESSYAAKLAALKERLASE